MFQHFSPIVTVNKYFQFHILKIIIFRHQLSHRDGDGSIYPIRFSEVKIQQNRNKQRTTSKNVGEYLGSCLISLDL